MKLTPNQKRQIKEFSGVNPGQILQVNISSQTLRHFVDDVLQAEYPVSTSGYGSGQELDSQKTPVGLHKVYLVLGRNGPAGQIFKDRQPRGIITPEQMPSSEDYILSRVLCLEGLETGLNRGGSVDSKRRYIYIHGTNQESSIGKPSSIGCIRMKNDDIIQLVDQHDLTGAVCNIQG